MVDIALVGAGFIGKVHSGSYNKIKDANVIAVIDVNKEKGKKLAEVNNANFYTSLDECLKKEEVDIVDICTPTFTHVDLIKKAADLKINIFCEKPLALSLKDADQMIKAVENNKVKAMVGFVLRFWPEYLKVKEIIESGEIGKPLHGHLERLSIMPEEYWLLDEKYSGGAAVDLHCHDLDYITWIFGKPKTIKAQGVYNPEYIKHGGMVHIVTNIEFKNGISGMVESGWAFKGAFPFTMLIRILCENGTVEWISRAGVNIEKRDLAPKITIFRADGSIDKLEVDKRDAYVSECEYFIDCVVNNRDVKIATFRDGRDALKFSLAAIKSAKEK